MQVLQNTFYTLFFCANLVACGGSVATPNTLTTNNNCSVEIKFRPRLDVAYQVEVRQTKQLYRSRLRFMPQPSGFQVTEDEFSITGGVAEPYASDLPRLASTSLLWRLDPNGSIIEAPVRVGEVTWTKQISLFQFRRIGWPEIPVCEGTRWSNEWHEDGSDVRYDYQLISIDAEGRNLGIDGTFERDRVRWHIAGFGRLLHDGVAGELTLHVEGPRYPDEVTEAYDRHIVVAAR